MASKDYYSILGVKRNATEKEIKQAYRRLARKYHPDVNPGDRTAEEHFKEIGEAYDVLRDAGKRRQFDQFGTVFGPGGMRGAGSPAWQQAWRTAGSPYGARTRTAGGRRPGGIEFDLGGIGDLNEFIQSLFGRGVSGREGTRPRVGEDIEREIEVSLEEAASGGMRHFQVQVPSASGEGLITEGIEVKIPLGVRDGTKLRLAGRGASGPFGGPRGDLYLKVRIKPHARFERDGDDLQLEVPVGLTTAALGGEVDVSTLSGSFVMKVPAESQNGRVLRLAGLGMPRLGGAGRGDLYAKLRVVLPTGLSERERDLFDQLRRERQGRGAAREPAGAGRG